MKAGLVAVLFLVPVLVVLVPGVEAAADPVGGLRAYVLVAGNPSTTELRIALSPDDPNQDTGNWTYNVTVDAGGGFVNLGATTGQNDFVAGDGFQTFRVGISGAPGVVSWNVTADDGTGPVDGCVVTIDTGVEDDYDACGDLVTTFSDLQCISPGNPTESGWNYKTPAGPDGGGPSTDTIGTGKPAMVNLEATTYMYQNGPDFEPAVTALNLGGDTASIRVNFEIVAASDAVRSKFFVSLSGVDNPVGLAQQGDLETTGAFANALTLQLTESGNDWDMILWRNTGGNQVAIASDTWSAGVHANIATAGFIEVDAWSETVTVGLGSELVRRSFAIIGGSSPGDLHQLWMGELGLTANGLPKTRITHELDSLCVQSLPPTQGGGQASIGTGGGGLEDFGGQGGVGGAPMFPGVNVTNQASNLGVDVAVFAWILAAILLAGTALVGFMFAGLAGSGLGMILGVVLSVFFNLIALWLVVVLFMLAVVVIVFGVRQ